MALGHMTLFLASALPLSFQELDGVLEEMWMLMGPLAWLDVSKTVSIAKDSNVTTLPGKSHIG